MTADALKSASITALDTLSVSGTPILENTSGAGAAANMKDILDFVTPTTGGLVSTSSKYKMVRLPTSAKLKTLTLKVDGALDSSTGLALDVGAYYSDSTVDGTPAASQGTSISVNCFAAALTSFRSSAVADVNALTAFALAKRNKRLWDALGLTSDPGGFIDIVVAVQAAATTAVSSVLGLSATFTH